MTKALQILGALLFGFSLLLLVSMLIGQDCNGNPGQSPFTTIQLAAKGVCTYNQ
jgi:hypothetical protein